MGPEGQERRQGNRRRGERREGDRRATDRRAATVLDEDLIVEEESPERKAQFAKARSTRSAWAALYAQRAQQGRRGLFRRPRQS